MDQRRRELAENFTAAMCKAIAEGDLARAERYWARIRRLATAH